jgi:hypothetical protein
MNAVIRRVSTTFAILIMIAALAVPARADTLSGTYRIVTRTGIHMIITIIQNGDSFSGMYVGQNGNAGRISGRWPTGTSDNIPYTWEERQGDGVNPRTVGGWGNLKFNDAGTGFSAAWGYAGQQSAVGFWTGTVITP